jgi:hypothetical protein
MRPRTLISVTALLTLLMSGGVGAQRSAGEVKFLKMSVPGKVERVAWSVQSTECSIQIWGPSFRIGQGDPTNEIQSHEALLRRRIQVWLLRSDGTAIPHTREPEGGGVGNDGSGSSVATYYFPASARTTATSVVVSVDGQFLVEPLPYVNRQTRTP